MNHEKKPWSQTIDINAKAKFCVAVRMVECSALEAFEDVSSKNESHMQKNCYLHGQ